MRRGGSSHHAHSPVVVRWAPCGKRGPTRILHFLDHLSRPRCPFLTLHFSVYAVQLLCFSPRLFLSACARIKGCVVFLQSIMKLLRGPPLRAVLCVPKRSQTN